MKHADMVPLVGMIVTVHTKLVRAWPGRTWEPRTCRPWAGWIVGWTWKLDGRTENAGQEESRFIESSRQLCVLVKPWPTMKAVPVALDGYEIGGTLERPDWGGWRAVKAAEARRTGRLGTDN